MSDGDIAIYGCYECGGPIWFPSGQKMHIGTGWPCWKNQHGEDEEGEEGRAPRLNADFVFTTNPELLQKLAETAVRYYTAWRDHPEGNRPVKFLRTQLQHGRSDVIYRFLGYLTTQRDEYPERLLRAFTATPEWKKLVRTSRRRVGSRARANRTRRHRSG